MRFNRIRLQRLAKAKRTKSVWEGANEPDDDKRERKKTERRSECEWTGSMGKTKGKKTQSEMCAARKRSSFKLTSSHIQHTVFVDKFVFFSLSSLFLLLLRFRFILLILSLRSLTLHSSRSHSLVLVKVMPYLAFNLLISGLSFVWFGSDREAR